MEEGEEDNFEKCEVKRCRLPMAITCIGVALCDKHYEDYCNGKSLETHKGLLTHKEGKAEVV